MTIHKYIETDNLIKYQNGRYKGHIDWSKNIDNSIYFEYEDIKGYIKIINYEKSKQLLTVVYFLSLPSPSPPIRVVLAYSSDSI